MKFKEWLNVQESQKQNSPPNPFSGFANAASRFGSAVTQLPVPGSPDDLDNALYAGLAGGVGNAVNRNLQRMGHNIGQLSRIEPRPRNEVPHVEHGTLPLQLPIFNDDGELRQIVGDNFTYGKAGLKNLRGKISSRSYEDEKIRTRDDGYGKRIAPKGKFQLYNKANEQGMAIRSYQTAANFTQALIHVMIRDKMDHEEKFKNKFDTETMKLESSQVNDNNGILEMTCVFSIKPKQIILNNKEEE